MSRLSAALRRLSQLRRAGPAGPAEPAGRDCPPPTDGPAQQPPPSHPAEPPRVAGRVQCIQLPDYRIYVDMTDELVGACIARGGYEPHVTRAIATALRPGDTFVDLGSNIGYYSLLAATLVGSSGSVIGFEARPDNVHLARLSVRENGFRNVTLHNLAVSDRNSTLKMYAPEHTSLSKVVAGTAALDDDYVSIPAVALDDVLADVERVDLLKMDIDGGEARALAGMSRLLARCRPTLFFEFAPFTLRELGLCEPEAVLAQVLGMGYRLAVIPPAGEPLPFATAGEVVAYQQSLGDPRIHVDLVGRCD